MRFAKPIFLLGTLSFAALLLAQQAPAPAPPVPPPASPQEQPSTPPAQVPVAKPGIGVVVLDPGHGGTDAGARGASGVMEKDITMSLARAVQAQLERQGFFVVLTRHADEDPTIDERAALANAQRGAIFISLHVSSLGAPGTALAFYQSASSSSEASADKSAALVRWEDAQRAYVSQSRKLAELIQIQFGQKLRGSVEVPQAAAVRQLRFITAPAVAVELNSVAVKDRKPLDAATPALAEAIVRAVASFKTAYEAGAL